MSTPGLDHARIRGFKAFYTATQLIVLKVCLHKQSNLKSYDTMFPKIGSVLTVLHDVVQQAFIVRLFLFLLVYVHI
jgi:hypothetical protein